MGLFDSIFGGMEASPKLSPQEAFMGILLGASGCDGHIAEDEVSGLFTVISRMKLYQRFTDKHFSQSIGKVHGIYKKKGVDALIDACVETIPAELRDTAFANACDIVLADGVIESDEKQFVENLCKKLNVDRKLAHEIVQVMVTKNKG